MRFYLQNENINPEDICIVGSAVLNVFGLRESRDVDIIVADKIANKFSQGPQKLNDEKTLEKVTKSWLRDTKGKIIISDDKLIYDDNFHFNYEGFKFVKLDLVYLKKTFTRREKDIQDLTLIENFLKG